VIRVDTDAGGRNRVDPWRVGHPSASFSATLRVRLANRPGAFARLAEAIGKADGLLDAIDLVRVERDTKVRDVTVLASDAVHAERIVAAVRELDGVEVVHVSDRTFLLHLGGKIEVVPKAPLKTRDDLSMAYTPGVARISQAIADDVSKVWNLTTKQNAIAVVTDGTAVLGLGDIGPEAALPVMEGKAMLFKEFGGVDAWPICLDTKDPDEIVAAVAAIAPGFGGINLEDISAPRCFEIEARLRELLDIPVFHDDQHGTAVVVLAALLNALRVVGKDLEDVTAVVTGVGAAGVATTRMLLDAGIGAVIGCDREGALWDGRPGLSPAKARYAEITNPERLAGTADEVLAGADVFIGLSGPGAVSVEGIRAMAPDAIVFAMANPAPEVAPEEIEGVAAVVATGRSDYPNQINNVLAFPGMFRGALDVRASAITREMELAAARAIANAIAADELEPDYVVASVFNRAVAPAVAAAVAEAAERGGVARRTRGAIGQAFAAA
jgi:malate dehydrogenase (oxaloacetate-decarboxylating)